MDELPKSLYEHLSVHQFKKRSSINKYISKAFLTQLFIDALPTNRSLNRSRLAGFLNTETAKSHLSLQYLNFLKILIKETQSDGVTEGLIFKMYDPTFVAQLQSLPKNLIIKSKEDTAEKVSMKGYVSTLMAVKTKPEAKEIELLYSSRDDLLYDIYVAGQCLAFFAIYLPTIFRTKFIENSQPMSYRDIINEFRKFEINDQPATIFITQVFKDSFERDQILDKKAFISTAANELPDFIDLELNHPMNLPRIIHNLTWDQRKARLRTLQDIYTVINFFENNVQTEIRNFILNTRDKIVSIVEYNQTLQQQLHQVKLNLLNPNTYDEELVFNILGLQKLEAFLPSSSQGFNGLLSIPFEELVMIQYRKPIDLQAIQNHPTIYLDFSTLDRKYQFLSPMNIDFSFEYKDKMRFMSPAHFSLFRVLTNMFGLSDRVAHRLMMKSKYESKTFEQYQQDCDYIVGVMISNRLGQSVEKNILSPLFPLEDIFQDTKETTLYYLDSDNTFLGVRSTGDVKGNFLGKYVQVLRDGNTGTAITEASVLRWFDNKLADMTSALKLYGIDTKKPNFVREFLSTVFRFPIKPVSCNLKNRFATPENKVAFEYLSQFLGTILTDISLRDFEAEVKTGQQVLKDSVNEETFKRFIPAMVEGMEWYTSNNKEYFSDNLSKLMTMLLKKAVRVNSLDEAWEMFIINKRLLDQNYNRFNFFKDRLLRSCELRRTLNVGKSPEYNPLSP